MWADDTWSLGGRFLTGPLSHLPSLASQPSHALLSPLRAHSTGKIEKKNNGLVLHDWSGNVTEAERLAILHNSLQSCGCERNQCQLCWKLRRKALVAAAEPAGMNSMSSMAAFTSERLASWLTLTANVRSTDLTKICISAGDFPGCSKKGDLSEQTAEKRTAWDGDHSSSSNCGLCRGDTWEVHASSFLGTVILPTPHPTAPLDFCRKSCEGIVSL